MCSNHRRLLRETSSTELGGKNGSDPIRDQSKWFFRNSQIAESLRYSKPGRQSTTRIPSKCFLPIIDEFRPQSGRERIAEQVLSWYDGCSVPGVRHLTTILLVTLAGSAAAYSLYQRFDDGEPSCPAAPPSAHIPQAAERTAPAPEPAAPVPKEQFDLPPLELFEMEFEDEGEEQTDADGAPTQSEEGESLMLSDAGPPTAEDESIDTMGHGPFPSHLGPQPGLPATRPRYEESDHQRNKMRSRLRGTSRHVFAQGLHD